MKKLVSAVLAIAMSLMPIGCTDISAKVEVQVGSTSVEASVKVTHKKVQDGVAPGDATGSTTKKNDVLVDVPPGFTVDTSTTPQAVITITTDTSQTFSQTFNLVQDSASGFAPAASGTQTFAFTAQDPAAVTAFVQSAVSHANATVSVSMQSNIGLIGPTDGSTNTVYGRDYNSDVGVQNLGSATYTAPTLSGGTRCTTRICPNQ